MIRTGNHGFGHERILALSRQEAAGEGVPRDTAARILRYGAPVGCEIEHFSLLDRCLDRLRQRIEARGEVPPTGLVVRADELVAASGRFQRAWYAPAGGLHLALLWADTLLAPFSRFLPFAIGLACCETVHRFGVAAALRWVNDVLVRQRKIAGILCETHARGEERYHLIGIGLNVNLDGFPAHLQQTATSLCLESGQAFDLEEVFLVLLARLQWNLGWVHELERQWLAEDAPSRSESFSPLLKKWLSLSDTPGRRVVYGFDVERQPLYEARVRGLDPAGGLEMELADGTLVTEYSGEIRYLDAPCG